MKQLGGWLKDLLFPRFCVSCQQEGGWLCDNCLILIPERERLLSHKESDVASHLDGVTALFHYGGNTVSKLITMFKYNFLSELAEEFKKIISITNFSLPYQDFTIMAVPLHPRRQRERGFNQAALLAEAFAEKLLLPIGSDLHRSVYTAQQATLSAAERSVNLSNTFVFETKNVPEKVLIVDDVFTTGATMNECAKILKQKGVQVVWGLAVAHGG